MSADTSHVHLSPTPVSRVQWPSLTVALVIMVSEDGQVENRIIDTPAGLPVSALSEASNYLGARLRGFSFAGRSC